MPLTPFNNAGPLLVGCFNLHIEALLDLVSKTAQDRFNEQIHRVVAFAVDGNSQARNCIANLCNHLVGTRISPQTSPKSYLKATPVITQTSISIPTLFLILIFGVDAYVSNQFTGTLVRKQAVYTWIHVAAQLYAEYHTETDMLGCLFSVYESVEDFKQLGACLVSNILGSHKDYELATAIIKHAIDTISDLEDCDDATLVQLEELEDELESFAGKCKDGHAASW